MKYDPTRTVRRDTEHLTSDMVEWPRAVLTYTSNLNVYKSRTR